MKEKTQQISEEEYEQIKQELEEILEIQEELKLAVEENINPTFPWQETSVNYSLI